MTKLIIRDISPEHWPAATKVAQEFLEEYPDRFGRHNYVIWVIPSPKMAFVIYRTKTSIIVRSA